MTPTQAQIEAAAAAMREVGDCALPMSRWEVYATAALTAAAEVGEPKQVGEELGYVAKEDFDDWMEHTKTATIERCAQVADAFSDLCRCEKDVALQISAAIRALKDKP